MQYDMITVIFNPNSTGKSEEVAKEFAATLRSRLPSQPIEVLPTERPQHAEMLAYETALRYSRVLVVSSSGDGGYHEVVNGVIKARKEGRDAVAAILPAGNANDHYRNLNDGKSLADKIIEHVEPRVIDVLAITGLVDGKRVTRYAHSYIGFGLTPYIGSELNRETLNYLKEVKIVAQSLWQLQPVPLRINGRTRLYDSIIMSNITTMSKYLRVAPGASVADGEFEVTVFRNRGKVGLIWRLIKMVGGASRHNRYSGRYTLETVSSTAVQVDGEIVQLDEKSQASVSIVPHALPCLV